MLDQHQKDDIDKISKEILKQSKAYDTFPTPVDKIVNYAELNVAENINLSKLEPDFFDKFSGAFKNTLDKIRGLLDREEKVIYLDLDQTTNRKNFVKLHEVGHDVLPWQKATLKYLDNNSTLDLNTSESFEAEANYFASATLFQHDRFIRELNKLPLGIESSLHLSKFFGASIHATLRRYVEHTKKRCALIVLENLKKNGFSSSCEVRNYFQSTSFMDAFGKINWELVLNSEWAFVQDYTWGRRLKQDGNFQFFIDNEEITFQYHFFNSSYNSFVLFFPKGEVKKSKVKIIIKE